MDSLCKLPIHNGIELPFGYMLGAQGLTDFMVNAGSRLSLHRRRLIERRRWDGCQS